MKNHKQMSNSFHAIGLLFKSYWIIFIPGLVGLLFFGYHFDLSTINPTNDTWITGMSGDISQHYLGWQYFRESAWHFPYVGYIDQLPFPSGTSIMFLDSIPLFALFFKLFNSALPQTFQYLGLFTALSFVLQGIFSALILTRFTKRRWLIVLGSIFFITSPLLLGRAFAHTALTAHWLILLAIFLLIYFHQRNIQLPYKVIAWSTVMVLAILIHPYFVPIIGVILLLSTIDQHKDILSSLLYFSVPALAVILILWMLGGLSSGTSSEASGLGIYGTNLLSLVIPLGYSSLFTISVNSLQWEGLGYLGLGVLLLAATLCVLLLKRKSRSTSRTREEDSPRHVTIKNILYTMVVLGTFVFALSPLIYFGNWLLITIPLPQPVENIWSIFRSTGRIFWPLYYLLLTFIIASLIKNSFKIGSTTLALLMTPLLLLQVIDITQSPIALEKRRYVAASLQKHPTDVLNTHLIQSSCSKDKVIVLDDKLEAGTHLFHDIPQFLIQCTPPINNGYFARPPKESILSFTRQQRQMILTKESPLPDNILYMTRDKEFADAVRRTDNYNLDYIGSYWIVTTKQQPPL